MENTDMTRTLITNALLAATLSLPLLAQGPGHFGGPGSGPGHQGPGQHGGPMNFMAGYLNLTDSQKEQAKAIHSASAAQMQELQGKQQSAREALQNAVKQNKSDGEIDQLTATMGALHGQSAAIMAKQQKQFRAILTAEQLEKLDSREGRRGGGPRGKR